MNLTMVIIFSVLFFTSWAIALLSIYKHWNLIKTGLDKEIKIPNGFRIQQILINVFLQKKIMQRPLRGIFHVFIFYGFLVYGLHSFSQFVGGFLGNPYFYIPDFFSSSLSTVYAIFLDIFTLLVLAALLFFLIRRYFLKAKELDRPSFQSLVVATMISLLMIFSLFSETSKFMLYGNDATIVRQVLSSVIIALPVRTETLYLIGWWGHVLSLFAFLIYVPSSKHAHLIWAPINFWFQNQNSVAKMQTLNIENTELWGASSIHHFTWKNLLDSFACIECGRCELVCPATRSGKPLSPKKIMGNLKHNVLTKMPLIQKEFQNKEEANKIYEDEALSEKTRIIGSSILESELWSCTTCYACVQECPVGNHQPNSILEMRRSLVLNEGSMPSELAMAMTNLENQGNPWGISSDTRSNWAKEQEIKVMSELTPEQRPELLFWVGCAGSFEERNKKISSAFARLLKKAGVNFAILGNQETCTGDSARRAGNEYLFQNLAAQNIENLNGYGVKKIVTTCPHCYNTLKNEYPDFGGHYQVMHHSEFLNQLVKENKFTWKSPKDKSVLYHDSCYLGRANQIFSEPRSLLNGYNLKEAKENHEQSMCCGAGGAQMWMEEQGIRINEIRAKQLIHSQADIVASACPFCMIMLRDGMQEIGQKENLKLEVENLDIAEILEQSIE